MAEKASQMKGVLVVDKPRGITSHDVVDRLRRLFGLRRIGHTGTLDPFATGVMVVCVGRATRVAKYFEVLDKAYRAVLKMGVATETGDCEGDVVEVLPVPELSRERLEEALEPFRGTIAQRAPAYSAVKVGGEPLYARARRGEHVEGPTREVTIRTLQVEFIEADQLTLFIECSKGTYIRSLAHDIGLGLGCGAHCLSLERTRVGPFTLVDATSLEDLEQMGHEAAPERLMQLDNTLSHFMEPIVLTQRGASLVVHGNPVEGNSILRQPKTIRAGAAYRALDEKGRLIAIIEAQRQAQRYRWLPRRVMSRG